MLAKLQIQGAVGCFLVPSHAAQICVALEKLRPEQAIIVIAPEMRDLAVILHCEDFRDDIESHRLWFAAGAAWEIGLRKLLDDRIGLATPTQFIRAQDADAEQIDSMIAAAQKIFCDVNASRSAAVQAMSRDLAAGRAVSSARKLCVVAPSRFRLWNDIGHVLTEITQGRAAECEAVLFDADDPLCSSPLALLNAARQCSAILTANTARSDLPGLLPETAPWITWITAARIPSSALAGMRDHLIVADPSWRDPALKSGWPADRVHVGTWPRTHSTAIGSHAARSLSIIADTAPLDTPTDLSEYSSHSLLWEAIRHELTKNPFVIDDVNAYLAQRMRRLGVGEEAFARNRFVEKLVVPAYQQGLARVLIRAGLPIRLWGEGWDELAEFRPHAAGAIRSREILDEAVSQSAAVVHVWPTARFTHPIDTMGIPVVRNTAQTPDRFLHDARSALAGRALSAAVPSQTPLSAELLAAILQSR
jgi:hypothetical protein